MVISSRWKRAASSTSPSDSGGRIGAAVWLYLRRARATRESLGYDLLETKQYLHDLELDGGKANVLAAEFGSGSWAPVTEELPFTIAVITIMLVGAVRFTFAMRRRAPGVKRPMPRGAEAPARHAWARRDRRSWWWERARPGRRWRTKSPDTASGRGSSTGTPVPRSRRRASASRPYSGDLPHLGIAGPALELGKRAAGANIWAQRRRAARIHRRHRRGLSPYPFLLILGQDDNERLLGEFLGTGGMARRVGTSSSSVSRRRRIASHATLRQPGGTTREVAAAWVAGCDGARSAVRDLQRHRLSRRSLQDACSSSPTRR